MVKVYSPNFTLTFDPKTNRGTTKVMVNTSEVSSLYVKRKGIELSFWNHVDVVKPVFLPYSQSFPHD